MSRTLLLRLAAACGLVHAAFSLYWAVGGRWLLDTVGTWATDWSERAPATAAAVLLVVAGAKTVAALLPLAVARGRWSWARTPLRVAGLGLLAYGAANTIGAWLVLTGVAGDAGSPGSADRAALVGHAVLWDPLFAAWGLLLALGLRRHATYDGTPYPRKTTGRRTSNPHLS